MQGLHIRVDASVACLYLGSIIAQPANVYGFMPSKVFAASEHRNLLLQPECATCHACPSTCKLVATTVDTSSGVCVCAGMGWLVHRSVATCAECMFRRDSTLLPCNLDIYQISRNSCVLLRFLAASDAGSLLHYSCQAKSQPSKLAC